MLLMLQGQMNKTFNNKNKSSKEIKNKNTPGVCPRCRKGKHWRNKCGLKSDIFKNDNLLSNYKKADYVKKREEGQALRPVEE